MIKSKSNSPTKVGGRRKSTMEDVFHDLGSARSRKNLRRKSDVSDGSARSGRSRRSSRRHSMRKNVLSVFPNPEDRVKYSIEKRRVRNKVQKATELLEMFLDESAMKPIRDM